MTPVHTMPRPLGGGEPRVLVVDDVPSNIEVLRGILRSEYRVLAATNGAKALAIARSAAPPDVILLDVMMPGMDGYEVCRALKADPRCAGIPVILVSARDEETDQSLGFDIGAVDYLLKPVQHRLVQARVRSALHLAATGRAGGADAPARLRDLEATQKKLVVQLAHAAESRGRGNASHAVRTAHYAYALAIALGQPDVWAELLRDATPLHDVGKIGIPMDVLERPGPLDEQEMALVRTHAAFGATFIGEPGGSGLLAMAATIAQTHHERWDGQGYPQGLAGEDIPLAGRIVAIVDVFDALLSERPYRPPWLLDEAIGYLKEESGRRFDPGIVTRFLDRLPEMLAIRDRFSDRALARAATPGGGPG